MKTPKFVYVRWNDAHFNNGAIDSFDDIKDEFICEIVGWLIKIDSKSIVIASEFNNTYFSSFKHVHTIPKEYVKQIRELKMGKSIKFDFEEANNEKPMKTELIN